MKTNEQGFVIELDENEIFVFGSNIKGEHAGGAAKQAFDDFGAIWGAGEGLQGQSYAFPTLDEKMQRYDLEDILDIKSAFYRCTKAHPELTFYLTPIGTGIAGYAKELMERLFKDLPSNVQKINWK